MNIKILVITPVKHIYGVSKKLNEIGDVTFIDDPQAKDILKIISNFNVIFTNPNKSKVYLGEKILNKAKNLKVICTASTGTNHINLKYAKEHDISVLSLTEERELINQISSTAEHAFALTMSSIRKVNIAYKHVLGGDWDYEGFIGRQMNGLTIGVVGYGRLGSLYAKYCNVFDSKILVFDPYKKIEDYKITQIQNINILLKKSDIISLHVHVNDETINMVDKAWFDKMKSSVLLVNTSRGEIVNELDLINFLKSNPDAKVATDVLSDEILSKDSNPLLSYAKTSSQVLITPHIGGMTKEAQELAYNHAVKMLKKYIRKN